MREQTTDGWVRALCGAVKRVVLGAAIVLLAACSTHFDAPDAPGSALGEQARVDAEKARTSPVEEKSQRAAEERPGLATGFGESIHSVWNRQSFVRARATPAGTGVVYYNDREGFEAMSGGVERAAPLRKAAGGRVEWGIRGGTRYLPAYESHSWRGDGRRFVVGKQGDAYSIVIKNLCKSRLELVLSVDGLDVIDGRSASYSKRGYIIAPGETLEIEGWRTSPEHVARFRFSTVSGSYANLRHGEHRNVGVIGLAVFDEQGVDPWKWMPDEVSDRFSAKPF